jgi:hypothetical protein
LRSSAKPSSRLLTTEGWLSRLALSRRIVASAVEESCGVRCQNSARVE